MGTATSWFYIKSTIMMRHGCWPAINLCQRQENLLPAGASLRQIMDILHKGKSLQRRLTIVEGQTSAEIVTVLEAMPALTGAISRRSMRAVSILILISTPTLPRAKM